MTKVYKVVARTYDDELVSLEPPCKSLQVIYPVGDWARAKIGALICFDSAFNAYRAYSRLRWYLNCNPEIWESLGSGPVGLPSVRFNVFPSESNQIEEQCVKQLWDGSLDKNHPLRNRVSWWPHGSLGFEAVSLQRPVFTRSFRSDERGLSGRAYELAREVLNKIDNEPIDRRSLHTSLWFRSRREFINARDGRGQITVSQGFRAVSYGIELLIDELVEPLFYELVEFTSKGK
jgi:hypothetical protein